MFFTGFNWLRLSTVERSASMDIFSSVFLFGQGHRSVGSGLPERMSSKFMFPIRDTLNPVMFGAQEMMQRP